MMPGDDVLIVPRSCHAEAGRCGDPCRRATHTASAARAERTCDKGVIFAARGRRSNRKIADQSQRKRSRSSARGYTGTSGRHWRHHRLSVHFCHAASGQSRSFSSRIFRLEIDGVVEFGRFCRGEVGMSGLIRAIWIPMLV